jgi:hypothetical protein
MDIILTRWQHNFDFHMDHNTDAGTNIIWSIFHSDKVDFMWWEIEMHYLINGDQP